MHYLTWQKELAMRNKYGKCDGRKELESEDVRKGRSDMENFCAVYVLAYFKSNSKQSAPPEKNPSAHPDKILIASFATKAFICTFNQQKLLIPEIVCIITISDG